MVVVGCAARPQLEVSTGVVKMAARVDAVVIMIDRGMSPCVAKGAQRGGGTPFRSGD